LWVNLIKAAATVSIRHCTMNFTPTVPNRASNAHPLAEAPDDRWFDGLVPTIVLEPAMHLQTGTEVGAEALSRFAGEHDTRAVFRVAHRRGVGVDLELRSLALAIDHLDATDRTDDGFVGVNLSAVALTDPRCLVLLEHHRCQRLVIELTDQSDPRELALLRRRIDEVRELSVRIALHVEGTVDTQAFSVIQPDMAKLRISRWHHGAHDDSNLAQFLSGAGVFVIAVGVDRASDITSLQSHGVDAAQGHVYGLPRTASR
jgi:EAL domain-containing protein (putative c-di-GMP-specific phosphodiesterase class I)